MLVLTRKPKESVFLTNDILNLRIQVKFLGKNGSGQIRLGFEAPDEFDIAREELLKPTLNDDHHPHQFKQPLKGSDESLIKVCS